MSFSKRTSSSSPSSSSQTQDLKIRVITCLNKLSDRDTAPVAANELEFIARTLTPDSFLPFLSCLSATDSSEKLPVRKQCVRLLGLLSSAHGDALSPHISKMLSALLRRLRDSDSAVRSACVEAVSKIASQVKKPPFSSISKPFVDSILVEQDYNLQIGASLCLAAAIEASPDPESALLQKLLPKLLKLAKSDCFKAKPALLTLIGAIVSAGGAGARNVLSCLVPCLVDFLSSEDWAARKASAEALERLALAERNLLQEFKSSCLASLEKRRYDRVKVVRERMKRALEAWKEVSLDANDFQPQSVTDLSIKDCANDSAPAVSKSLYNISYETSPVKKTVPMSRSPPCNISAAATTFNRSPLKSCPRKPGAICRKLDSRKSVDWKIESSVPQPPSTMAFQDNLKTKTIGVSDALDGENCSNLKPDSIHVLFSNSCDELFHKFGRSRYGSRVVPFNDNYELDKANEDTNEFVYGKQKEIEDLSLIQQQLVQIEHQQSNLLDLLQRFIGSSKSGMNSLETRVNGLEKALDEMSHDLAMSTGRISNCQSAPNACCTLPGAEFLTAKFWRRTEARSPASRFPFLGRSQSSTATVMHNMPDREATLEIIDLNGPMDQHQYGSESLPNSPKNTDGDSRGSLDLSSSRIMKNVFQSAKMVQVFSAGGLHAAPLVNCIEQQT